MVGFVLDSSQVVVFATRAPAILRPGHAMGGKLSIFTLTIKNPEFKFSACELYFLCTFHTDLLTLFYETKLVHGKLKQKVVMDTNSIRLSSFEIILLLGFYFCKVICKFWNYMFIIVGVKIFQQFTQLTKNKPKDYYGCN